MAYARFSETNSDVYVIGSFVALECMACRLTPDDAGWFGTFTTNSRSAMLDHLHAHRHRKYKVPFHATRRLKREIKEEGDTYR